MTIVFMVVSVALENVIFVLGMTVTLTAIFIERYFSSKDKLQNRFDELEIKVNKFLLEKGFLRKQ